MVALERHYKAVLAALILIGVVIRLAMIHHYPGTRYDISNNIYGATQFEHHKLHVYAYLHHNGSVWPYPPLWMPVSALAIHFGHVLHVSPSVAVRVPLVIVDAAVILLVQYAVRLIGGSKRAALGASALVAIGPPFLAETALQGQLDMTVALSVIGAAVIWLRAPQGSRWLWSGLVIGAGAAIKTVPILGILALLPTAMSNRERLKLTIAAVAVPALIVLPFELVQHDTVHTILEYHGLPGLGGLSLLVQPSLSQHWPASIAHLNGANTVLHDLTIPLVLIAIGGAAWFAIRHRVHPYAAAALVYGSFIVISPNFFLQYGVWLLIPLIAMGWLRLALALSIYWVFPIVLIFKGQLGLGAAPPSTAVYALMGDVLLASLAAVVVWLFFRSRKEV